MASMKPGSSTAAGSARRAGGHRVADIGAHTLRRPPPPPPVEKPKRAWLKPTALLTALAVTIFWIGGFAGPVAEGARDLLETRLAAAGFIYSVLDVRGVERTGSFEIQKRIGAPIGAVIFDVDPARARAAIEELDWVRHAAVIRLLPNRIVVIVEERRAAALWRPTTDAAARLIDDTGAVIEGGDPAAHRGLPMVVGRGAAEAAPELAAALVDFPQLRRQAQRFVRVGERRWDVRLRSGAVVQLPQAPAAAALARFDRLNALAAVAKRPLAVIDLRNADLVMRQPADHVPAGVFERDA